MTAVDPALKRVLQEFSRSFRAKREAVLGGYDFEALRTELADLKDRALERNEELLARFEERARAHGSVVWRAKDGAEANELVLKACRDHGVGTLVKTKSMVSEETELNAFLAGRGVAARETDLGEWIVQLAAERPTHMVMPAIHMTRGGVASVFSRALGREVPDDIPSLVRIARAEIRKEIFSAHAGLTGANALVAGNGAIVLVTNEGNGRLVTTVPPVHIVLASIEKVLPGVRDALSLLRLLPRNATGQSITSYVSWIAGPHAAAQYVILLDNHRREMLADPAFRDTLRCVKCSACLNVCPVYQVVGGGEYSHIYMGGIGTLFTAWIHGLEKSKDLAGLCLRCHRCDAVCATKIPIADRITALAAKIAAAEGVPLWKRAALEGVMGHPAVLRTAFAAVRTSRPLIARKDGFSRRLPRWMRKYDRFRALPAPAPMRFTKLLAGEVRRTANAGEGRDRGLRGSVAIFPGCLIEHFYPEIGLAAARVLARLGYAVRPAPGMCCGFPASNAGLTSGSARAFTALLNRMDGEEPVVTLCPTCTTMLARRGAELTGKDQAKALAARIVPFSRFVIEREGGRLAGLLGGRAPARRRATYHDSCHHKNVLAAERESRRLVEAALGRPVVEMSDPDSCCGFAGSFTVENPEISAELLADKLDAVAGTGADIVALDCPGCLFQIRGGCRRRGLGVRVAHTAELLDSALR